MIAGMDVQSYMHGVGRAARAASRSLAKADTEIKNHALTATAEALKVTVPVTVDPVANCFLIVNPSA